MSMILVIRSYHNLSNFPITWYSKRLVHTFVSSDSCHIFGRLKFCG